jgi:hypothetical protein
MKCGTDELTSIPSLFSMVPRSLGWALVRELDGTEQSGDVCTHLACSPPE